MEKTEHYVTLTKFNSIAEVNQTDQNLVNLAIEATKNAYAVYSGFHVGAALLLSNNQIITGTNQENIAYPSGLCAERVAAFSAKSNFPKEKILTIAIAAKSKKAKVVDAVAPCGSCRQALIEYELLDKQDIRIILTNDDGEVYIVNSVKDLLPFFFNSEAVKGS